MTALPICINCEHYERRELPRPEAMVIHEAHICHMGFNLVTGAALQVYCGEMRAAGGACGPEGRLFMPMPKEAVG